ncbi:MAG: DNA adenine methylase [Euryarchaeota archaeon]|nr:DNA adenine methylase [Euryarchaeota archaeon]
MGQASGRFARITRLRARPFVKWAGGKAALLAQFHSMGLIPPNMGRYHEPFLGGGALFFDLAPDEAVLIDSNEELVVAYEAVRDSVDAIVAELRAHEQNHNRDYFYATRRLSPRGLSEIQRAARLIYLNKTCFNGLYRVNSKGEFNVPLGSYKNPKILDQENLLLASKLLRTSKLAHGDFEGVLNSAKAKDFIYFDPPYDPLSETSNFTAYTKNSFGRREQSRLADVFSELDSRGCHLLLSNSDTPFIRDLYKAFITKPVRCPRFINSKGTGRGNVDEIVVTNLERPTTAPKAGRIDDFTRETVYR